MSITLDAITLPDDLVWQDEYQWDPVAQSSEYTLTGALIVEESPKLKGRPITLSGAWITKSELDVLRATLVADSDMALTLHDARIFTVRWRFSDTAIAASQVVGYADPAGSDYYELTLRFIEV